MAILNPTIEQVRASIDEALQSANASLRTLNQKVADLLIRIGDRDRIQADIFIRYGLTLKLHTRNVGHMTQFAIS